MSQIQQHNRQQAQQAQRQVPQKVVQQPPQNQVVDAQEIAQFQAQRAHEQHTQQIYKQIINEEKKVYGKKYPQRKTEPSMFELLSWQDEKQQKQDFKSNHVPNNEADQYKILINKSNTQFQSEQRDNYRQFYFDKEEGVLIPEVEPEVLDRLKGQQQQIHHLSLQQAAHDQQRQETVVLTSQQQQAQQMLQESHHYGPKTNYQRDYDVDNVKNSKDLINIIQKNHRVNQKQSEALLEQAQKNKRSQIQVNHFYEEEQIPQIHQDQYDDDEDDDGNFEDVVDAQERQRLREQRKKEEEAKKEAAKVKKFSTVNTKNVKSKLIKYKPQAQKLDPSYQKERITRRKDRIKHMEETTRWLPNSAFTTYFGKPAFENYGRGNVQPTIGGCVYGQYLLSHNVNPHRGIHQPKFIQSYNNALNFGERLPDSEPQPPRNVKEDFRLSQNQVEELKNRNPLTATRNGRDNLRIQKPDLVNTLRFASNENSPVNVANNDEEKRKRIKEELKQLREGTKAHTQSVTQFQEFSAIPQKDQKSKPSIQELQGKVRPQTAVQKQVKIQSGSEQQQYQQQQQQQQQHPVHAYSQYQPQQLTEEQIRANQEWADDLPHKKIIDELNKKKAQKNRLALKVTEVIPVITPADNYRAGVTSEKKNKSLSPTRNFGDQPRYNVETLDLEGLPIEVQSELREKLHNPKLYKNAPSQFTKHIPYAGKAQNQQDDIKSIFSYQHVTADEY